MVIKKLKYFIGDIGFTTKTACADYTKNLIKNIGYKFIDENNENFIFFMNLIKNHPDFESKQGCGIKSFQIVPNAMTRKDYALLLNRIDCSQEDFSWRYCCEFKQRTIMTDLTNAMRSSISNEIISFKMNNELKCQYCGVVDLDFQKFHVDHNEPPFRIIKDNFLKETKSIIPQTFGSHNKFKTTIFNEEDISFEKEWVDYHNSNCSLQILCADCNLIKH